MIKDKRVRIELQGNIILTGGRTISDNYVSEFMQGITTAFQGYPFTVFRSTTPLYDVILGGDKFISSKAYKQQFESNDKLGYEEETPRSIPGNFYCFVLKSHYWPHAIQ